MVSRVQNDVNLIFRKGKGKKFLLEIVIGFKSLGSAQLVFLRLQEAQGAEGVAVGGVFHFFSFTK